HRVGTLDEDFAFDSLPGDIFQLGNTAYRIAKVQTGTVFVEDARGQPPTVPFWFGEALGRSDELSAAVSRLNAHFDSALAAAAPDEAPLAAVQRCPQLAVLPVPPAALAQLTQWLAMARAALATLPTLDRIIFERFFDEVGDSHLVIHSPFGSRINKAWGLALRKRFCRQFNFELQASAMEDSIVLSLGPTHSFPLAEVGAYLHPATARQVLVQALLDAPMFPTHWRWCATVALAIRRNHGGKRRPPQFQRSDAEDLLTVVFPDQVACAENLAGEREVPDHPLVAQALHDCLHQTMDVDGFMALVAGLVEGRIELVCRDLTGPSPLAGAILNARPWAFLDDGDAEARRTRAVGGQGARDLDAAAALARPDPAAIARVREEIQPLVRDADELHDALVVHGFLAGGEWQRYQDLANALTAPGRAVVMTTGAERCLVARERLAQFLAAVPQAQPKAALPDDCLAPTSGGGDRLGECPDQALLELLRGRLDLLGPTTAAQLGQPLALPPAIIHAALIALEGQGSVMRGCFDPELVVADAGTDAGAGAGSAVSNGDGSADSANPASDLGDLSLDDPGRTQWCERRLLARIHRYSREQRHARVRAVPPARLMTALAQWQHLSTAQADLRREGDAGLLAAIGQLEGWIAPVIAWERDLLPRRVRDYAPDMLDRLCASGQVVWWRPPPALLGPSATTAAKTVGNGEEPGGGNGTPAPRRGSGPIRSTPIMLLQRSHLPHWQRLAGQAGQTGSAASNGAVNGQDHGPTTGQADMGSRAWRVHQALAAGGALFWSDLEAESGLLRTELEQALAELVGLGLVVCDSFAGLRALVTPVRHSGRRRRQGSVAADAMDHAGRWSLLRPPRPSAACADTGPALAAPDVEHVAWVLLRRYGVVFRALLAREQNLPPWRDLHYVYRRLEARGEINGGRFVSGFSGEQFALADAATRLAGEGTGLGLVTVSAADPLNLAGVIVPGNKVTAVAGNRVAFADGVAVASRVAGKVQITGDLDPAAAWSAQLHLLKTAPVVVDKDGAQTVPD
ncbi:MAG: ATP-dependent DNA helicase, partial [Lysobacterales bacterium]